MKKYIESNAIIKNNYLARNANSVGFSSTNMQLPFDFKLVAGSPLIDGADIDKNISFDFSGFPRPYGVKSDIGAFEYDFATPVEIRPIVQDNLIRLLQNTVKDFLLINLPKNSDSVIYLKVFDLNGKLILQLKQLRL